MKVANSQICNFHNKISACVHCIFWYYLGLVQSNSKRSGRESDAKYCRYGGWRFANDAGCCWRWQRFTGSSTNSKYVFHELQNLHLGLITSIHLVHKLDLSLWPNENQVWRDDSYIARIIHLKTTLLTYLCFLEVPLFTLILHCIQIKSGGLFRHRGTHFKTSFWVYNYHVPGPIHQGVSQALTVEL